MAKFSLLKIFKEARRRRVYRAVAVYVVGSWVLLQVAALAFDSWGIPTSALRYVWIGALAGLPLIVVLAWNLQFTEHGLVRFDDKKSENNLLALDRRDWVVLSLISIIVIATALGVSREAELADSAVRTQDGAPKIDADGRIRSIAVLPFLDFSSVVTRPFLAEGISEAILHVLAQNKELLVTARTSSFYFKGKDVTAAEIGQILGVQTLLEGSIQIEDDTLRVTSQLVRTSDQSHIWSDVYEAPLEDIFSVQDEIAQTVAQMISQRQSPADSKPGNTNHPSIQAYELVLEGKALLRNPSGDDTENAIRLLRAATEISPEYSEAYSWLSEALTTQYVMLRTTGKINSRELFAIVQQAQAATSRALELDSDNAMAILQQGMFSQLDGSGQGAHEAEILAASVAPNDPHNLAWLASLSTQKLDFVNAATYLDRARAIDPSNFDVFVDYIWRRCKLEPISGTIETQLTNFPVSVSDALMIRQIGHSCDGRYADAVRTLVTLVKLRASPPDTYRFLAWLSSFGIEEALSHVNEANMLVPSAGSAGRTLDNTVFFSSIADKRNYVYQWLQSRSYEQAFFTPIDHALLQIQLGDVQGAKGSLARVQALWEEYYSFNSGRTIQEQTLAIYAIQSWLMLQQGKADESIMLAKELLDFLYDQELTEWDATNGYLRDLPLLVLILNGRTNEAVEWLRQSELHRWEDFQVIVASPIYADFRQKPEVAEILARMLNWRNNVVTEIRNTALPEVLDPSLLLEAISSTVSPGNLRLGEIELFLHDDLDSAAEYLEEALAEAGTDFWTLETASILARQLGQFEDNLSLRRTQAAIFEKNPYAHYSLGLALFYLSRWDEALESLRKSLELSPGYGQPLLYIGLTQVFKGDPEAARVSIENLDNDINKYFLSTLMFHSLGDSEKSDTALNEFLAIDFPSLNFDAALLFAFRNEGDRAFEYLDQIPDDERSEYIAKLLGNPLTENLRDDARWLEFLRESGRAPEQLEHIEFHVPTELSLPEATLR